MRWVQRYRTEIRGVIDKFLIYDHVISMLRTKMRGAGSPCTYFRNSARTFYGTAPVGLLKCYCWGPQDNQPDRAHPLCMGTGYLDGYQKYGYREEVVSTPSPVTKDPVVITSVSTTDKDVKFIISSPTVLIGNIQTQRFALTRFEEVDRFLVSDQYQVGTNRVRYYYSTDDITWTQIPTVDYNLNRLGNRQGTFTLPEGTPYVRFRITLEKRYGNSPSPSFNSLRFRYRNQFRLVDVDPKFGITGAAFLAAREQQTIEIRQGASGWETTRPLRWWTLPEVDINDSDIIKFLQGALVNQCYEVQNLTPHVHGPNLKLLHKSFQSDFIRDDNDVLKIISLLT